MLPYGISSIAIQCLNHLKQESTLTFLEQAENTFTLGIPSHTWSSYLFTYCIMENRLYSFASLRLIYGDRVPASPPAAVSVAMENESDVGLESCVSQDLDGCCSTHRRSAHPC